MAASSKFEFSSSSSDGPVAGTSGQRVAASLERPGSFREAAENRIGSRAGPAAAAAAASAAGQGDAVSLLQTLVSDMKAVVGFEQKISRPGELRRSISSIFGISQEDSVATTVAVRPLPSSSVEEIRRLRNNIHEGSVKASDRAKVFGEAASKMDKSYNNLLKKRSRTDLSSGGRSNAAVSGGSTPKMGPQSHLTASSLEIGPHKSEGRAKSSAPSRKLRTSLLDMDPRSNGIARPSASMDRDRDTFRPSNDGATPPEEKVRALTEPDSWEKTKMKKKRSAIKSESSGSATMTGAHDGDRESKRGLQQKLVNEARPRLNNSHGFRSGISGAGKLDSTSQPNGIGVRSFPRSDQDNDYFPNERRERLVGSEKEGATLRAANKPTVREENYAASPTSTMKMSTSVRAPRSNSGSLSKAASPNMNRAVGNSDDWDHQNTMNKLNNVVGAVNRKRSSSARSSPPPNWGGQRLQKKARVARRSNLPPVGSSRDDFPATDMQDNMAANDDGLGFARRTSVNCSQQSKSRSEQAPSTRLSESEDSGVVDVKSKDKSKKSSESEEKAGASIQKVATLILPQRKSKIVGGEDLEDGVKRHGKISRGTTPTRSSMPVSNEKLDTVPTAKQMKTTRISYDNKIESKSSRTLTKKWSDRKGHSRPRNQATGAPSEFSVESDDDHEELLAVAEAAMKIGRQELKKELKKEQKIEEDKKNKFWLENEQIFRFLSVEDQEFLNQEIRLSDEAATSICDSGDCQSLKADPEHSSVPSTPNLSGIDGSYGSPNGTTGLKEHMRAVEPAHQSKHAEPFLEDLMLGNVAAGVSICQALLSAIIEEEEIEIIDHINNNEEGRLYGNTNGLHFDVDAEIKSKGSRVSFGTLQAAERAVLYSCKANTGWRYQEELTQDLGINALLEELVPNMTGTASPICTEFQYSQMSINDRILLELSEIGVYPEPVPYLAQSEDEDIIEGINSLTMKLQEQALKKKKLLLQLNKTVEEARESQLRELEQIALDRLVGLAYEKYMVCWGPNASKSINRANKQATLAFIRRTLARYRGFEDTGTSCFSEPAFRDMFFTVSSHKDESANAMDGHPLMSGRRLDMPSSDQNHGLAKESSLKEDIPKYPGAFCGREEQWSNKLKKRELLLDEVVGSATGILKASSVLGGSLISGTKGKRSERDREGKGQSRDYASRNGMAKISRPSVSNAQGERKNKSKPKQKMTQLSASVNGLLGKATEVPNKNSPSNPKLRECVGESTKKDEAGSHFSELQDLPNDPESIDLSHLQLPEMDVGDFDGQGQDIGSWLNIEEDGLQDHDFMGLEIPMDDLSEVNMMF